MPHHLGEALSAHVQRLRECLGEPAHRGLIVGAGENVPGAVGGERRKRDTQRRFLKSLMVGLLEMR
jgi:hypothetical protein